MPCLVKEIPIPEGLLVGNLMCVLCEHAVVLLEVSELLRMSQEAVLADYSNCQVIGQEVGCSDKRSILPRNMMSVIMDLVHMYVHTL